MQLVALVPGCVTSKKLNCKNMWLKSFQLLFHCLTAFGLANAKKNILASQQYVKYLFTCWNTQHLHFLT